MGIYFLSEGGWAATAEVAAILDTLRSRGLAWRETAGPFEFAGGRYYGPADRLPDLISGGGIHLREATLNGALKKGTGAAGFLPLFLQRCQEALRQFPFCYSIDAKIFNTADRAENRSYYDSCGIRRIFGYHRFEYSCQASHNPRLLADKPYARTMFRQALEVAGGNTVIRDEPAGYFYYWCEKAGETARCYRHDGYLRSNLSEHPPAELARRFLAAVELLADGRPHEFEFSLWAYENVSGNEDTPFEDPDGLCRWVSQGALPGLRFREVWIVPEISHYTLLDPFRPLVKKEKRQQLAVPAGKASLAKPDDLELSVLLTPAGFRIAFEVEKKSAAGFAEYARETLGLPVVPAKRPSNDYPWGW